MFPKIRVKCWFRADCKLFLQGGGAPLAYLMDDCVSFLLSFLTSTVVS